MGYIFYERHWDNIAKKMEASLVGEIKTVYDLMGSAPKYMLTNVMINFQFARVLYDEKLNSSIIDDDLRGIFNELKFKYNVNIISLHHIKNNDIYAVLENGGKVISFSFSHKKLNSPTTLIFSIWMIASSFALMLIALMFMKNQIRAILQLAEFAEKLGKGQELDNFKPSGAAEVRKVGKAFLQMKHRIERQIYYRTQMLAHISHDLRTPLTRMRLTTEFIKDHKIADELNSEISGMEIIIVDYLNFAKEEGNEKATKFDLIKLLEATIAKYNNPQIIFANHDATCEVNLRKVSIQRALVNIIDNALKYYKSEVRINFEKRKDSWILMVDDDGMGIPKEYMKLVFKPFYKMDKNSKGFGLGLSSVKSIIYSHGGKIKLAKSSLGGLSVIIKVPF